MFLYFQGATPWHPTINLSLDLTLLDARGVLAYTWLLELRFTHPALASSTHNLVMTSYLTDLVGGQDLDKNAI
jgi:hypothetical protein